MEALSGVREPSIPSVHRGSAKSNRETSRPKTLGNTPEALRAGVGIQDRADRRGPHRGSDPRLFHAIGQYVFRPPDASPIDRYRRDGKVRVLLGPNRRFSSEQPCLDRPGRRGSWELPAGTVTNANTAGPSSPGSTPRTGTHRFREGHAATPGASTGGGPATRRWPRWLPPVMGRRAWDRSTWL